MNWSWKFVAEIAPNLVHGFRVTILVTLVSYAAALALGLIFTLARMSSVKPLGNAVQLLSEGIRRTPLLVQLYFLFYVLPDFGILLSPLTAGIIGLATHNAAYISEVYRAGIDNVSDGQWEAAKACNLTRAQAWIQVILPQAIPPMIAPLGNYLIAMFKESALLSAITVLEFMGSAMAEADYNYRYLEPITIVALGYLAASLTSAAGIKLLEKRFSHYAA
ncbi:ectoine/hydroxyectoine ABC transporter permease subunit EhuD [Bradyrhizobium japonicum]|uniref:ectoine/hydroxyectoine ABC transporter permease subunit EhuD n=1 Tax=Bradyrhizobium japonicum TaxID=375 RepID=UPI0004B6C38D|nr:ectoine/hydroxyectoine ABC transporter permease subunit EhuD [Bradyrhizobium japonicum]